MYSFHIWPLFLSTVFAKFIPVVARVSIPFLSFLNSPCMDIHLPADGYLGCFHLFGYYEQSCHEHSDTEVCKDICFYFSRVHTSEWNCWALR